MSQPPAFQFYASDYLSSSKVQRMTLEAEGAYIRLLAYNWQDGSIPADVSELAKLCKTTPKKMAVLWDCHLRQCFVPTDADPDRLVNLKMEAIREGLVTYSQGQSDNGKLGAEKRWGRHKHGDSGAIKSPMANDSSSVFNLQSSVKGNSEKQNSPPREPDLAYEFFREKFEKARAPAKYRPTKADFVQLAGLRKDYRVPHRGLPEGWEAAVRAYLESVLSKYTLADLCSRYDVFLCGSVDRFGKPIEVNDGKREKNSNTRAAQDFVSRKLAETIRRDIPDVRKETE